MIELNEEAIATLKAAVANEPKLSVRATTLMFRPWQLHKFFGWSLEEIARHFDCSVYDARSLVEEQT